jgi:hypothetical protein
MIAAESRYDFQNIRDLCMIVVDKTRVQGIFGGETRHVPNSCSAQHLALRPSRATPTTVRNKN